MQSSEYGVRRTAPPVYQADPRTQYKRRGVGGVGGVGRGCAGGATGVLGATIVSRMLPRSLPIVVEVKVHEGVTRGTRGDASRRQGSDPSFKVCLPVSV